MQVRGPLSVLSAWHRRPLVRTALRAVTEEKGIIMNSTVNDVMTTSMVAAGGTATCTEISAMTGRVEGAVGVRDRRRYPAENRTGNAGS